jgi:hypothetical protein
MNKVQFGLQEVGGRFPEEKEKMLGLLTATSPFRKERRMTFD